MEPIPTLPPNPVEMANPMSRVFFSWMDPIFKMGYKKELEIEDVYRVPEEDRSERLGDILEKEWKLEQQLFNASSDSLTKEISKKPSLICAFARWLRLKFVTGGFLALFEECVTHLAQPLFLAFLIRYCGSDDLYEQRLCYYMAFGIVFTAFAFPVTHHTYFFQSGNMGMKMRVASCSLLYRKALRLSRSALGQTTAGQMVNLISNDVNRFDVGMLFIHYIYVGPIQLAFVTLILWLYIGVSVLAGIGLLIMYIPLQFFLGKLFSKYRFKVSGRTDERIRIMTEILGAMKVIKMYAWEKSFRQLVDAVRLKEMQVFRHVAFTRAINGAIFFTSSKIILLLIFGTMVVTDNALTSEKVFITVALINVVRVIMTQHFPNAVALFAEMVISVRRIEKILLLEELEMMTANQAFILNSIHEEIGIRVENIRGSWNQDSAVPTLRRITFASKPGTLTAIVGPVGSGKSSLLMALLGELPLRRGSVQMKGKVAFVSQEPWAFSGTVRNNILFGQPYDQQLYDTVIEVCALKQDLKSLPFGDQTCVTDKGGSLSGGQRARVALARAAYFNADLYILDDPLSAVDMCVGQHIFTKCIKEFLGNKVCILATHQNQFLKEADNIIALDGGRCVGQGTFEQLSSAGIDVVELLSDHESKSEGSSLPVELSQCSDVDLSQECSKLTKTEIIEVTMKPKMMKKDDEDNSNTAELKGEIGAKGGVHLRTYVRYFRVRVGVFCLLVILLLSLIAQALYSCSDYWLKIWTDAEYVRSNKSSAALAAVRFNGDSHVDAYMYAGLVAGTFVVSLVRSIAYYAVCIASSTGLHDRMFNSIIRSPMSFFDANSVGRILNRFSRDMGLIDDQLPVTSFQCFITLLNVIGILIVVAIVNPWILLAASFLFVPLFYLRKIYLKTMRYIRRIEGISRSPVYSHLSASLHGLPVIRAFKAQPAFIRQFDEHQDVHSASWYLFMAGNRWLGVRLDFISSLFITTVIVAVIFSIKDLTGGDVGLAISSALLLSGMFQWGVRQSTDVENQMISVERILDYCELPSEAQLESKPDVAKSLVGWPQHGEIKMNHVSLSYVEDGPFVLKDLNVTIRPKEKIGIVGRTGAGKSSIISALFRLTEPLGDIIIDGMSIRDIGLNDLRKRISIIPQDPFLFSGTVRQNLDHYLEHSDDALWQVLDEVQLKSIISGLDKGLEASVSEGGVNFSCGQRQLICLARAILMKNTILILDEATANVDFTTDALIRETIKTKFDNCTVLTIAHRLQTVVDSDRILVLDVGCVVEFDEPYFLLRKKNGFLRMMIQNSPEGIAKSRHLRKVAKRKHVSKLETTNSTA